MSNHSMLLSFVVGALLALPVGAAEPIKVRRRRLHSVCRRLSDEADPSARRRRTWRRHRLRRAADRPETERSLGQPVVVDNRIGATGLIAMETAKAPADGYTYIVFNIAHLTYARASLSRRTSFDTATAFTPVSQIATGSMMLAVHPAVPGGTLSEFVAHAKSRPGAMAYASGGPASMRNSPWSSSSARPASICCTSPGTVDLLAGQYRQPSPTFWRCTRTSRQGG